MTLGMSVQAQCFRSIHVESVNDGSWAALAGVQPGDRLATINGRSVEDDAAEAALSQITNRDGGQGWLTFVRPDLPESTPSSIRGRRRRGARPARRALCAGYRQLSLSSVRYIAPTPATDGTSSYLHASISGRDGEHAAASPPCKGRIRSADLRRRYKSKVRRPQRKTEVAQEHSPGDARDEKEKPVVALQRIVKVMAERGIGELGLHMSPWPPPLRVCSVSAGTWAQQTGLVVGDELVAVEAWGAIRSVFSMTEADKDACLSCARPLRLVFALSLQNDLVSTFRAPAASSNTHGTAEVSLENGAGDIMAELSPTSKPVATDACVHTTDRGVNHVMLPKGLVTGPPIIVTAEMSSGINPVPADVLIHSNEGVDLALPRAMVATETTMMVPFHDAHWIFDSRKAPPGFAVERLEDSTFSSRGFSHASRCRRWL